MFYQNNLSYIKSCCETSLLGTLRVWDNSWNLVLNIKTVRVLNSTQLYKWKHIELNYEIMKDIVEDERKEHEHYPMTWINFNAQQYTQDRVGKQHTTTSYGTDPLVTLN